MTLAQAVQLSLSSNLALKTAAYDPAKAGTAVRGESGIFDPELFGEYRWAGFAEPLAAQLDNFVHRRSNIGGVGIRHRLPMGWSYSVEYRSSLERSLLFNEDDIGLADERDFFATLVIPLLRGAGSEVTRAGIDIALLNHQASLRAFEQTSLDLVLEVERAYWALVQARMVESVRRRALANAEEFLRLLNVSIKEGAAAPFEAYEAQQNVENQRRDLEEGLNDVVVAEQRLSRLLGVDPGTRPVRPTQDAAVAGGLAPELEFAVQEALGARPLLRQAELALDVIDKQLLVAKNQMLPRLDAVGEHRLGDSRTEPYAWQVGLELTLSLGNRDAVARYEFVKLSQEQALVRLEDLRQRVRLEVADAVASWDISLRRAAAAAAASEMAQKRVDAELARFRAGFTPSHRVVFAQQQQLTTDEDTAQSLISLELARSDLRWATGSAIRDFSLEVVPVKAFESTESKVSDEPGP